MGSEAKQLSESFCIHLELEISRILRYVTINLYPYNRWPLPRSGPLVFGKLLRILGQTRDKSLNWKDAVQKKHILKFDEFQDEGSDFISLLNSLSCWLRISEPIVCWFLKRERSERDRRKGEARHQSGFLKRYLRSNCSNYWRASIGRVLLSELLVALSAPT